jgi:hypothetical protein
MEKQENPSDTAQPSNEPASNALARLPFLNETTARAFIGTAGIALASLAASRFGIAAAIAVGVLLAALYAWDTHRRSQRQLGTLALILESVREADATPIHLPATSDFASFIAEWNETWSARCTSIHQLAAIAERVRGLPNRLETTFGSIEEATSNQEEAVEETASTSCSNHPMPRPLPFSR